MSDIKKIMAAVGTGRYAEGIIRYAEKLALALDADLLIANVINERDVEAVRSISSMGYEVDGEHYVEGVRVEREKYLSGIVGQSQIPDRRIEMRVHVGNPIDELLKIILEGSVDMIVMGPKGRTDLAHVLVGSVASKLFRRSPVTVVSYRGKAVAKRLKERFTS